MNKKSNYSKLIIITLTVLVLFIGIGLAAYSGSLNIISKATIKPNSSNFSVKFSTSSSSLVSGTVKANNETLGAPATLSGTTVSGITANFSKPGDYVSYQFYVRNDGRYNAYLKSVKFGSKTCTPKPGSTDALVQAACKNISLQVVYGIPTGGGAKYQLFTNTTNNITDQAINIGYSTGIVVEIRYNTGGTTSDGDFTVNFGDIEFNYSTVS